MLTYSWRNWVLLQDRYKRLLLGRVVTAGHGVIWGRSKRWSLPSASHKMQLSQYLLG